MNIRCQYRFENEGSNVSTARRKSRDYWEYFFVVVYYSTETLYIGKQVFLTCFLFFLKAFSQRGNL